MALDTYLCDTGQWTPLRSDLPPIPFTPPEVDPDPDPGPNPTDLGTPGNRPALVAPPDETSTGPRQSATQTMTGPEALTAIMNAPVETDGFRYLRRANITSGMVMKDPSYSGLIFEDCTITGGGAGYAVRSFDAPSDGSPALMNEFRFCEISYGTSAVFYGSGARLLRCNMHRGLDITKPHRASGGEVYGCYLHSTWHPSGAHCDIMQIVTGADGFLFHWNNLQGFNATDSPTSAGQTSNAVLQTGTMTGNVGHCQWFDNWVDGGHFAFRTGDTNMRQGHTVSYEFRRNKFGRNSRWGVHMESLEGVHWDDTNVWADTGLPVL